MYFKRKHHKKKKGSGAVYAPSVSKKKLMGLTKIELADLMSKVKLRTEYR